MFQLFFSDLDPNIWDHLNTGTGIWGGLSDGSSVQGETLCASNISGLRVHRNQNQPPSVSVVEQHEKISGEYQERRKKWFLLGFFCYLKLFNVYKVKELVEICSYGVIILKIYTGLMTEFSPSATQFPMRHLQRKICCVWGEKKWWVITFPPASTHIPHSTESPSRSVEIFYWCICGK